jgi:hypothetical protein
MADVRSQVALSLATDFEEFSIFKPSDLQHDALTMVLDQVVNWSKALARYGLRDGPGTHVLFNAPVPCGLAFLDNAWLARPRYSAVPAMWTANRPLAV